MSSQEKALRKIEKFAPDNPEHIRLLRKQVATRPGVIPFVGAGLSVPFGYKGWTAFLLEQAETLETRTISMSKRGPSLRNNPNPRDSLTSSHDSEICTC